MTSLDRDTFFRRYDIHAFDFEKTGLQWRLLCEIYENHRANCDNLAGVGESIQKLLRRAPRVHSIRTRVKDPEHVVEKIIRKKLERPERSIQLENYRTEISDLIGLRVLHLLRQDWFPIHGHISDHL